MAVVVRVAVAAFLCAVGNDAQVVAVVAIVVDTFK